MQPHGATRTALSDVHPKTFVFAVILCRVSPVDLLYVFSPSSTLCRPHESPVGDFPLPNLLLLVCSCVTLCGDEAPRASIPLIGFVLRELVRVWCACEGRRAFSRIPEETSEPLFLCDLLESSARTAPFASPTNALAFRVGQRIFLSCCWWNAMRTTESPCATQRLNEHTQRLLRSAPPEVDATPTGANPVAKSL